MKPVSWRLPGKDGCGLWIVEGGAILGTGSAHLLLDDSPDQTERSVSDEEGNDPPVPGLRRYPPARRQFGGSTEAGTRRRGRAGGRQPWRTDGPGGWPGGGQEGPALQALGPEGPGGRAGGRPHRCESLRRSAGPKACGPGEIPAPVVCPGHRPLSTRSLGGRGSDDRGGTEGVLTRSARIGPCDRGKM